ncbi:MAG: TonB-dependent receptor [Aureispira sp.]|nr:TonB-dependent receptor [Aureispira sp.]
MKRFFELKWLLVITILSGWALESSGQATLKGVVMDSVKNDALLGAEIYVKDKDGALVTGGTSDFMEGAFNLSVDAGSYNVEFKYMGFESKIVAVVLKDGETKELTVNMAEEVNMLKTVTKTATRFETSVGKTPISIDVVKPTLVDNTNATKVSEVVDKVPGVTVVDGQANIRGGSGYSYGAGSRVLLLVDDLPFLVGDAGFPNWRDIPVENIGQIEVVKGAASAMYGSSALNGIINVRTAYATGKPFTKFSLFQTSFMTPKRAETAWWKYDSLQTHDYGDGPETRNCPDKTCDTIARPKFLSGRSGYRKPIEIGVQFAHRRKIGKLDLTVGGNYFYFDSYRAGEYERKYRLTANTRYRFNEKMNIGINVNFNYGNTSSFFLWANETYSEFESSLGIPFRVSSPGVAYGTAVDTAIYIPRAGSVTETKSTRFNIDPFWTLYDKFENRHRIQTRFYYVDNQNGNNQTNTSQLFYGEYQYQRKFKIKSDKIGDMKVVAGAIGQYTFSNSELYGNAQYHVSNFGAYAQIEQGFFKEEASDNCKLNVTVGARYEYNTVISPDSIIQDPVRRNANGAPSSEGTVPKVVNTNPKAREGKPVFRVGLNYEAAEYTFIRASWGQGYRFPTIAERFIATQIGSGIGALSIQANPDLKSETGWSAEIGIKQGFKISDWKGFADVSAFWTEYQNMMEFTFGGGELVEPSLTGLANNEYLFFQSINTGNTRIIGAEASIMGTGRILGAKTNVMTGYTFIHPQFKDWENNDTIQALSSSDKNILKYRSVHTAKFDVETFFLKEDALSIGLSFIYNSPMQAVDGAFEDLFYGDTNFKGENNVQDAFGIKHYRDNINKSQAFNLGARVSYKYSFKNSEGNKIASLKLSLVGKNLLNQEYTVRPALMAAPASLTVRADVEF